MTSPFASSVKAGGPERDFRRGIQRNSCKAYKQLLFVVNGRFWRKWTLTMVYPAEQSLGLSETIRRTSSGIEREGPRLRTAMDCCSTPQNLAAKLRVLNFPEQNACKINNARCLSNS